MITNICMYEPRNNLILEIFYSTGIRISELVKIKIVDINLVDNSININSNIRELKNCFNIRLDCFPI